jgi:2-keto-3-deoxy-L-rhamnonate aldolase RhmA
MKKKHNVLRQLLDDGKPTIGTHVHSTWPGMVEVIGNTGAMDYIEFSGEYAPYDLYALENFGRAVDLFYHMTSMMKIDQELRRYLASRALGSGIQNLLFARVQNGDEAREVVAAARADAAETKGYVGAGMRRDVGYVMGPGSVEFVQALEDGVVAVMIEKGSALEALEDILAVDGIDMVQFGPADYCLSVGLTGQWKHPKVVEAQESMIKTAIRMGVRPRVELWDVEDAKPYLDMGVKDFCIGWDVFTIYNYCKNQGEALGKMLGR